MRSNEALENALQSLEVPIKYREYSGIKEEYIVYNEEAEQLTDYGDDLPQSTVTWYQVHIFTPKSGNFRKLKEAAVCRLTMSGFTVTEIVNLYERETKTIHVVINCHAIETEE